MKFSLIIYILILIAAQAKADECISRVRKDFNKSLENKVNVNEFYRNDRNLGATKDQGTSGFCYAYSAAFLLDDWLKRNGLLSRNEEVSAMGIGIITEEEIIRETQLASYHAKSLRDNSDLQSSIANLTLKNKALETKTTELTTELMKSKIKFLEKNENDLYKDYSKKLSYYVGLGLEEEKAEEIAWGEVKEKIKNDTELREIESNINLTISTLRKEIRHNTLVISLLNNPLLMGNEYKTTGGSISESINYAINNLCIEKEVNSKDNNIKKDFAEIMEQRFDFKEELACDSLKIINNTFPGSIVDSVQALKQYFEKLNPAESPFINFLHASCKKRSFPKIPEFKKKTINHNKIYELPVKNNDDVIKGLEEGIKAGVPVGIGYRVQILETPHLDPNKADFHASVVTGKLKVCGKSYYRLKNSYGENNCELNASSFPATAALQNEMNEILNECIKEKDFQECIDLDRKNRSTMNSAPFFCDKNGDYIVSKNHLIKGIQSSEWIKN